MLKLTKHIFCISYIMIGKGFKNICTKEYTNSHFSLICLKVASSFNIEDRKLKYSMIIHNMRMEGTVSQTFYSCLSFCFMCLRK